MPALITSSGAARRRYVWTAALTVLAALALAVPARAADAPFDFSAGDQYVETLPTTKGPRATDRTPKHRRSGLSPKARKRLQQEGGSAAATLQEVATSPELGAPVSTEGSASGTGSADPSSSGGDRKGGSKRSGDRPRSVPSAAIKAAGGTSAGIGWLVLGLPLITAAALGVFVVQRHRNRDDA